jgi:ABC-type antimicrobial peptide transport system ATPase subunit
MNTESIPQRLAAIRLCGYRGFPLPLTIPLATPKGRGRSLVLYGENGSGKSSLGKSIRDFLNISDDSCNFDDFKYRYGEPNPDRNVTLFFDDPDVTALSWTPDDRD